jgi:hypothetical protein
LSALQTSRQIPLVCERDKWCVSPYEKGFLVVVAVNCCVQGAAVKFGKYLEPSFKA